ncbi:hypothetical protein EHW64_03280 [Erwinia psidii]|uniref:RICIN domain-containing protein n=1 Tax=Erwinia psidii TaxID=69224 RepID=UPI00226BA262|nr:RICIN domain-containing protein [Erwinia psidii]MCX8960223.1 hypothetical protein [Erwinia psidii]
MIYIIPLSQQEDHLTITPILNPEKAMTLSAGGSVILRDNIESPDQIFTLTRKNKRGNIFQIRKNTSYYNFLWDNTNTRLRVAIGSENDNNLWNIDYQSLNESYVIASNVDTNKAIDVPASCTDSGTELIVYSRHNGKNQQFSVSKSRLSAPVYIASHLNSDKVLSSRSEDSNVIIYSKDSGPGQIFAYIRCDEKGKSVFQIENLWTGMLMTRSKNNGKQVFLGQNKYDDECYWKAEEQSNGKYLIANYNDPEYVLDVSNAKTDNGTLLQIIPRNGNKAQEFSFLIHPNAPYVPTEKFYEMDAIIRPLGYQDDTEDSAIKVAASDAQLIISNYAENNHLSHFHLVRARRKGYSVYQIKSSFWADAVLGMLNNGIYLSKNYYHDSQFWNFHYVSENINGGGNYIISNYADPSMVWGSPVTAISTPTDFKTIGLEKRHTNASTSQTFRLNYHSSIAPRKK